MTEIELYGRAGRDRWDVGTEWFGRAYLSWLALAIFVRILQRSTVIFFLSNGKLKCLPHLKAVRNELAHRLCEVHKRCYISILSRVFVSSWDLGGWNNLLQQRQALLKHTLAPERRQKIGSSRCQL